MRWIAADALSTCYIVVELDSPEGPAKEVMLGRLVTCICNMALPSSAMAALSICHSSSSSLLVDIYASSPCRSAIVLLLLLYCVCVSSGHCRERERERAMMMILL